jgi:hypothetical protein
MGDWREQGHMEGQGRDGYSTWRRTEGYAGQIVVGEGAE